jgi:DNA-binding XRE family transcriptional regulator
MAERKIKRIVRPSTGEERERHAAIREQIVEEFPPEEGTVPQESPPGIPTQVRQARQARGLTWYALAKLAGIPNSNTVRDIEFGRDVQLSTVQAVARVLGLRLELVEESV